MSNRNSVVAKHEPAVMPTVATIRREQQESTLMVRWMR